jgi:hypothetical protein
VEVSPFRQKLYERPSLFTELGDVWYQSNLFTAFATASRPCPNLPPAIVSQNLLQQLAPNGRAVNRVLVGVRLNLRRRTNKALIPDWLRRALTAPVIPCFTLILEILLCTKTVAGRFAATQNKNTDHRPTGSCPTKLGTIISISRWGNYLHLLFMKIELCLLREFG